MMRVNIDITIETEDSARFTRVSMEDHAAQTTLETTVRGIATEAAVRAVRAMNLPPSENPGFKGQVRM